MNKQTKLDIGEKFFKAQKQLQDQQAIQSMNPLQEFQPKFSQQ